MKSYELRIMDNKDGGFAGVWVRVVYAEMAIENEGRKEYVMCINVDGLTERYVTTESMFDSWVKFEDNPEFPDDDTVSEIERIKTECGVEITEKYDKYFSQLEDAIALKMM